MNCLRLSGRRWQLTARFQAYHKQKVSSKPGCYNCKIQLKSNTNDCYGDKKKKKEIACRKAAIITSMKTKDLTMVQWIVQRQDKSNML